MRKLSKKITLSILGSVLGVATGLSVALPMSESALSNSSITSLSQNNHASTSDLVISENNDQNANISTNNGPITFHGNKITALDWFGNKKWEIDFATHVPDKTSTKPGVDYTDSAWQRSWFNWDYNRSKDKLWVLGYYSTNTKKQPLFQINGSTGAIEKTFDLTYTNLSSVNNAYRFVSALSSGKVMVYGGAGSTYDAKALLYDPDTDTLTQISGNSNNTTILPIGDSTYGQKYRWYFFNLIPIANNKNLVEVFPFSTDPTSDDTTAARNASYDIYFLLVDDNLNMIETTGEWATKVKAANAMVGYRNTQVTPQRDYYTMLDGKVVTVVYNTAIIIDATGNSVNYGTFPMTDNKWIKSWAFDSNQNLYFKFKDDTKIYKVSGDFWKTLTSSNNHTASVSPTIYLDLSGISKDNVNTYASNFVIYNVYGYTGQLMIINSYYNKFIRLSESEKIPSDANYGLAIAVTQNENQQNQGDFKGTLNGPDSFQKASDFTIENSILQSKIPSEITKNDITTLNNSFIKDGDSSGFVISDIDDSKGTFKVTVNLYQIPWFTNELPSDSSPRTVSYDFTTTNKIGNKTSWKTLSTSTDYDFLNMLPSKVQVSDVSSLNPFQASFQSQTITNANGEQLYPKTTYSIQSRDDTKGEITVKADYQYVPMSANLSNYVSNVKSYSSTNTYKIFSNSSAANFKFAGQTNNETSIDVSQVPQLKNLLSANTLPSSFTSLNNSSDSTNSGFLQFVNTNTSKGYPISKMKFTVAANDTAGTLKIDAVMPSNYSPKNQQESFSVTYTNLNKVTSYKFSFNNVNSIGGTNKNLILPSAITDGDIINSFISYTGFSSNDFTITKTANDETGSLTVAISLNSNYASEIGNGNVGFTNYNATQTFTGFMTTDEYNQRFNVEFEDDSDNKLLALKQVQVSEIYDAFYGTNKNGLTIGSTKYDDLKSLIKGLLVKSQGSLIPTSWTDTRITADMYYDNSQGTISFYVKIPKELISGANSDLNLVANYTGFVKGNVDSTSDNLSFVANNMLKSYLVNNSGITEEQFDQFTPDTFAKWLQDNNNQEALKLISYKSGEYVSLLADSSKHKITVISNPVQRTVSVYVYFENVTDPKSLKEYSVTYNI
ncbi:hypothetical protein D8X55_04875 [Malacoplasma penetrans]|nr:lipoprotein 17-related variable surface protein [Malacoplasma penetrans]RXY96054.1 hypothetical protein D8X55_04875 [Malacoplasma penetrans]